MYVETDSIVYLMMSFKDVLSKRAVKTSRFFVYIHILFYGINNLFTSPDNTILDQTESSSISIRDQMM